jgi:hypothetical protein
MLTWNMKHPQANPDMLGCVPDLISGDDPRAAAVQIGARYGWDPMPGFAFPDDTLRLSDEPDDAPWPLIAEAKLRDETLRFYSHAMLAIIQPDGTFEVACID